MNRRQFLGTLLAAPAIVRASSLMVMSPRVRLPLALRERYAVNGYVCEMGDIIESKIVRPVLTNPVTALFFGRHESSLLLQNPKFGQVTEYSYRATHIGLIPPSEGEVARVFANGIAVPAEITDHDIVIIRNLQLEPFGNMVPDFTFEVTK